MLMLTNLAGHTAGLTLQTDQETVQRLGLARERTQEPHQAGLIRELTQDVDDHLVQCRLLTW